MSNKAGARRAKISPKMAGELLDKLAVTPAQFDKDFVFKLEDRLAQGDDGENRRIALLMLTQPWKKLRQSIREDKELAEAAEGILARIPDMRDRLEALIEFVEHAELWLMGAFATRKDGKRLVEAARADHAKAVAEGVAA